jgi:hypothetical protein
LVLGVSAVLLHLRIVLLVKKVLLSVFFRLIEGRKLMQLLLIWRPNTAWLQCVMIWPLHDSIHGVNAQVSLSGAEFARETISFL